jgi:hypothetical protein
VGSSPTPGARKRPGQRLEVTLSLLAGIGRIRIESAGRSSRRAASSPRSLSNRCPYTVNVNATERCPSTRWIAFGVQPAEIILAAAVCLRIFSPVYRYKGREIDPGDLWHVRAFVFPGSSVGLSPISYAIETIGLSLAVQRFGREFFKSGASPSGILSVNAPLSNEKIVE